MAWSKALSKGTPQNKSIKSTHSDNKSSGSTASDKSVQSTSTSNIQSTNNNAADDKSKFQSNWRLNLLFCIIHLSLKDLTFHFLLFIHCFTTTCQTYQMLTFFINFILNQTNSIINILKGVIGNIPHILTKISLNQIKG